MVGGGSRRAQAGARALFHGAEACPWLKLVLALGALGAGVGWSGSASAVVAQSCRPAVAMMRPGPVPAGRAFMRLIDENVPQQSAIDASELVLIDPDSNDVTFELEPLGDGSSFLRADRDLPLGRYTLRHLPPCAGTPFEIQSEMVAAPAELTSLGTLDATFDWGDRCPAGGGIELTMLRLDVTPTPEAEPYLPFMHLDIMAEGATVLDAPSPIEGLTTRSTGAPYLISQFWSCSTAYPSTTHPFAVSASLIDEDVTLPTLETSLSFRCDECPPPTSGGGSGGTGGGGGASGGGTATGGSAQLGEARSTTTHSGGCAVPARGGGGDPAWHAAFAAMVAAAGTLLRRRARDVRRA